MIVFTSQIIVDNKWSNIFKSYIDESYNVVNGLNVSCMLCNRDVKIKADFLSQGSASFTREIARSLWEAL